MVTRVIRRDKMLQMVQLSNSTIYDLELRGEFPKRFALTPRCVCWDYDEVVQWLEKKKDEGTVREKRAGKIGDKPRR